MEFRFGCRLQGFLERARTDTFHSIGAVGALWRNRARLPKNIFLLAKNVHQQLQVSGAALKFEASDDCVPVKFYLFSVLTDYKY